jgi:hypothetical protein
MPCGSAIDLPSLRDNLPGLWPTTGTKSTTRPETSSPTASHPAGRTTPMDSPHRFDLDDLSINPSNKEFFLQNINQDLSRDVPLLIEDRLKDLFSRFLSDLSRTVESIPSTLLESCLNNFNSSMKYALSKLITEEIVPSLIEKVIDNLSDKVSKEPRNHHCPSYVEELKQHIDEKLEDFQDVLLVRDVDCLSKFDEVKKEMRSFEGRTTGNFKYISDQISELNISENNRFEQLKRRLGDVCQTTYAVSNKLNSIIEPQDRDSPPHLKFNNPILNIQDETSLKPFPKEKDVPQEQQYPVQQVTFTPKLVNKKDKMPGKSSPKTENTFPNGVDEFPFIDHGEVNSDVRNQLWKAIPKKSEWEKFSGELPYNHELWLKNIDVFVQDYLLTDEMVVSRLTALFTDTAKNWYLGIRDQCEKKSWSWWKHTIRNKFGTHNWKWKMRMEFEKDYFTVDNRKVHKWFSTQRERLRAYQPELSESLVCEKVLKQCPGSLEHAVKSKCNRAAEDMKFEEMVIIIEEVLDRAMRQ